MANLKWITTKDQGWLKPDTDLVIFKMRGNDTDLLIPIGTSLRRAVSDYEKQCWTVMSFLKKFFKNVKAFALLKCNCTNIEEGPQLKQRTHKTCLAAFLQQSEEIWDDKTQMCSKCLASGATVTQKLIFQTGMCFWTICMMEIKIKKTWLWRWKASVSWRTERWSECGNGRILLVFQ